MTTWITICDTCKRDEWTPGTAATDGEALAARVEAAAGDAPVATRRISCLMGCKGACNVTIQATGKIGYTLGAFEASEAAARGIVDYAALHARSETGQVPYKLWPQAIKGHFVTRHFPPPEE